ncbi:MAG: T9SS type A sorting domain-containing protein [Bacteroidales bacterium]|nr:T9SS type A sorting domain-containing protein [Bacteroidales bacterium]
MKKLLSIISLVAVALIANAQFSLTYNGSEVTEGSTIQMTSTTSGNMLFGDADLQLMLNNTGIGTGHWTAKINTDGHNFSVVQMCGDQCGQNISEVAVTVDPEASKLIEIHIGIPENTAVGASETFAMELYNNDRGANDLTFNFVLTYNPNAGITEAFASTLKNAYPNPAVSNTTIEYAIEGSAQFVVTDIAGRQVMEQTIAGNGSFNLNVENFHRGVYLYGIRQGNKTSAMKKLVVR